MKTAKFKKPDIITVKRQAPYQAPDRRDTVCPCGKVFPAYYTGATLCPRCRQSAHCNG